MDEEEALAAAMAELGLPSAFGSSQAGHTAMRTSKSSRTVTTIQKSKPQSQAHSTVTTDEREAPSQCISHASGSSLSPESVQSLLSDVVDTETDIDNPWIPVWDSHYETTYYHNTVSGASQWEVPEIFSASAVPSSSSTLGSASHEQSLQGERKEDNKEKVSEIERLWSEASCSENLWAEAEYSGNLWAEAECSGNGLQIYQQALSVTETLVQDDDESQLLATLLEVSASISDLSAEFKLVGKGNKGKGKKKKMIAAGTVTLISSPATSHSQPPPAPAPSPQPSIPSTPNHLDPPRLAPPDFPTSPQPLPNLMMTLAYASADVPQDDWGIIAKYWFRRYSLFSRFDEGIRMDTEAWYSVTPEGIAEHQAKRCACDVIVDAFTGCGGNAIQFALTCKRVIAIDIDPKKIELARHNACVYGVESKIEFMVGDFLQLAPQLKADVVFLSPPWGGPGYVDVDVYDLDSMLMPCGGPKLFKVALVVAKDVALFVPRNSSLLQLEELTWMTHPPLEHDVEVNSVDERVKGFTAYYGSISQPQEPIPSELCI